MSPIQIFVRVCTLLETNLIHSLSLHTGLALKSLGFPAYLDPMLLSEEEGIEKPDPNMFKRTLERINNTGVMPPIEPSQCVHVGDEFVESVLFIASLVRF